MSSSCNSTAVVASELNSNCLTRTCQGNKLTRHSKAEPSPWSTRVENISVVFGGTKLGRQQSVSNDEAWQETWKDCTCLRRMIQRVLEQHSSSKPLQSPALSASPCPGASRHLGPSHAPHLGSTGLLGLEGQSSEAGAVPLSR